MQMRMARLARVSVRYLVGTYGASFERARRFPLCRLGLYRPGLRQPPMSTIEHPTTHVAPPQAPEEATKVLVSVVIPCLNEEENIEACVTSALTSMREAGIPGEVVVA